MLYLYIIIYRENKTVRLVSSGCVWYLVGEVLHAVVRLHHLVGASGI